jgi:ABC-type multidrug transport system fused ATPase/permease subunit
MESAVGEQGLRLSGGQAQRLALARALLRPAPLLLLDEPTSDLDAATEELILDTLRRLRTQRTILWISHRLKFTLEADQVLLLAGGHTIEQGKPDQLIQRDGRYAQLTSKLRGVAP